MAKHTAQSTTPEEAVQAFRREFDEAMAGISILVDEGLSEHNRRKLNRTLIDIIEIAEAMKAKMGAAPEWKH
jgi:hypothetical protein